MFGSKDLLFSSEKYGVAKSLRFRSGSTTYLNRTPASASNQKTWTWSAWVKRGIIGGSVVQRIFNAYSSSSNQDRLMFYNDTILFATSVSGTQYTVTSSAVYRDVSAWYHIVLAVDTTQGTSTNIIKIYVNGTQITFSSPTYPPQNTNLNVNSTIQHTLSGYSSGAGDLFDGYLAEVNFIDGQALTPSAFGFYDNNGIWQPQGYTGTYGTNGFYLKFTDVGATSGANSGYGKDFSGFNTNYWTTNNFGTTSTNTAYDSMYDSPVNASNGITGIGNYPVLNPLDKTTNATITNGNLKIRSAALGSNQFARATMTMPASNIYFEGTAGANTGIALVSELGLMETVGSYAGVRSGVQCTNGNFYSVANGVYTSLGVGGISAGTVIGLAYDLVNNKMAIYKDGVSLASNISISSSYISPMAHVYQDASGDVGWEVNFGQQPFAYTPPSGYSALNTQNLPAPTIPNGAAYMAAVTYTGSASTQNVTATSTNSGNNPNAVTFQPDLVWVKDRTNAQSHKLTDAVRGTTKAISTDSTAAEATDANGVTAFNNNGFSLGTGTRAYSDSNLDSYIAWQWKEGVSQGFDIVSYAGDNTSNRNISHNLGVAPDFVWVKSLSTGSFYIWQRNLSGNTSFLKCNSTDGTNAQTTTNTPWGTGNWSSTQFMVTNNATNNLNASSTNYIAYLWSSIAGFSAMGSLVGNGLADGSFAYTGFRPRWIILKCSTAVGDWITMDTSRDTYNVASNRLYPYLSNTQDTGSAILDILSNGFKFRNAGFQPSGETIIYAAFAENPFKIARAR